MATDPRDQEMLELLNKNAQQRAATAQDRRPWQEPLSRFTTVPASKVSQAAEVIAGMAGGWGAFVEHGQDTSHDSVGRLTSPQVKSYKLGQPGMPEINFPPYRHGTNRFSSKGPNLLGHPISLSVVGPTLKSERMDWQWQVVDNNTLPGIGDTLTLDTESVFSSIGVLKVGSFVGLAAGDTITITKAVPVLILTLTATLGAPGLDQFQLGVDEATTATNIGTAINNPANSTFGEVAATVVGDEVFVNSVAVNTEYTMTTAPTTPGGFFAKVPLVDHKGPVASSLLSAYGFSAATEFKGGLYLAVSQSGYPGDVDSGSTDTGLSDGFISDVTGIGKNPLEPLSRKNSKYEIFKVESAAGTVLTLSPNKRLASHFDIDTDPIVRAIMLFEPFATRLAAVPDSGSRGQERTFVVVPPERAATGEYLPPKEVWLTGHFGVYDELNPPGITGEYDEKVALPVPRPNSQRRGHAQLTLGGLFPPISLPTGRMLLNPDTAQDNATSDDVGKVIHVFRVTRTGTAPFKSPEGDFTSENSFVGWYEIVAADFYSQNEYLLRRLVELDPTTGRPFWGSSDSLLLDSALVPGSDLVLDFTVHDSISELFSAQHYPADKVESARLTNLIDPDWVERSAKTLASVEGFSTARPDRAIWDTSHTSPTGGAADPGSLLDLGFRMVLYPAKEGVAPFGGQAVPDFDNPITSREVTLDPAITDEEQYLDIDYSAGTVHFSHAPIAGTSCDVAPNGIVASENPREEIILFASCVPYSMEKGQLGAGLRTTAQPLGSPFSLIFGISPTTPVDVYGERLVSAVLPTYAGSPQIITSGNHQVIILDELPDTGQFDWPREGFVELHRYDENGPPALVGPAGENLSVFGYSNLSTATDPVSAQTYLQLEGVFGGGDAGVPDQISAALTSVVAVLRRDVRTPVSTSDNLAGTTYAQDTTYGFAKRSNNIRFSDAILTPTTDGAVTVKSTNEQVDVTVGLYNGASLPYPHFDTLAEAVAFVQLSMEPGGDPGRAWVIKVIGSTNETQTPITFSSSGIIIEGAAVRSAGSSSGQTTIRWSADTPLFDLNGKKDLVFQNLAFEYEDIGQAPSATVNRYVFANDLGSLGSRDVYNLTLRNCRFEGNGKAHGFLGFLTTGDDLADSVIEDCVMDVTDFGIAIIDARRVVIQRNFIYTDTASQQNAWDAGVHIGDAVQATIQENRIYSDGANNFNRGVVLLIGSPRQPCLVEDNRIEYTDEIAIHTRAPSTRIIGNDLSSVHIFAAGSATHGQPSKVGIWVDHSLGTGTKIEQNTISVYTPAVTDASILTTLAEQCLVSENRVNQTIEIGNLSVARENTVATTGAASKVLAGTECFVTGNTATGITVGSQSRVLGNAITDLLLDTYCEVTGNRCSGKIGLFSHCVVTGNEADNVEVLARRLEVLFESNRVGNGMTALAPFTDSIIKGNRWGASVTVDGDDNTIEGNVWPYDGLADLGIEGNRNVVSGNRQYRYTSELTIDGSDNNIEGNEVGFITETDTANSGTILTGNNLTRFAAGVSLQVLAANAVVANNHMEQTLYVDGAPNSTFTGNVIESGDLQIGTSDFVAVTGNRVGGAVSVAGCASSTMTGNSVAGDLVVTSNDPKIVGNKVSGEINVVGSRPIISNNETIKIRSEGIQPLIDGNHVLDFNTVSGTSQGGASSPPRIVLAVAASAVDDYYNGWVVRLSGGTGSGQYRIVTDYTGSTRVVYVSSAWDTNPDATTTYILTPGVIHLATSGSYYGVVKGNQCSAGIVSKEANAQVIADNQAAGLVLEGVDRNRVTGNNFLYDISVSSSADNTFVGNRLENMTLLAGANNIIQGNRIDAELSITSSSDFSTICGNYIGGNATTLVALTVTGTDDLTVIGNIFQNGRTVILSGVLHLTRMVFQGNRVDVTTGVVRINGSSLLASSNSILVANNLVGDIDLGLATSCVVEGNKCGAILCVGDFTHVQNNHATGDIILGPGLEVLVEGNRCHNISCTGNNTQVHNNKLGGGNDTTLTGASCIVTGNTMDNLYSSGGTCVLNSNIVQGDIRHSAGSPTPRPSRVVTVGNLVFGDQIYGVATGTHIAVTDHNGK